MSEYRSIQQYINILVFLHLCCVVDKWIKDHRLSYLAIPEFISQGQHRHGSLSYRFLVMRCFGEDVEKKFNQNGRKFQIKTVCHLALRIVSSLHVQLNFVVW